MRTREGVKDVIVGKIVRNQGNSLSDIADEIIEFLLDETNLELYEKPTEDK